MKKQILTFLTMISVCSMAKAQVIDRSSSVEKTELKQSQPLTFSSIDEKNLQIEKVKQLIDYRLSKGKTKEEMVVYYVELKKIQDALIIPKK
jgi:hypothetical protein